MCFLNPVIVVAAKDLSARLYYWRRTVLDILTPVMAVIFLNLSVFPDERNLLDKGYFMGSTLSKSCYSTGSGAWMTRVIYEPVNNFTNALMAQVKCLGGFNVRAGKIREDDFTVNAGVMFKGTDSQNLAIPDTLDYEVFSPARRWLDPRDLWWEDRESMQSYGSGALRNFFSLIHAIDESFLQLKNIPTPEMSFQSMDMIGRSVRMHKLFILVAFFLGFSYMVPAVVGTLVKTKRSGVKELVVMMGLKKWHLLAAKLFDCLWVSGASALLMVIFLYVPLTRHSQVLTAVPFCVFGSYLYLALLGISAFLCCMSCFFDSYVLGSFVAQVVWLASFVSFVFVSMYSTEVSFVFWPLCCLVPNFSFFVGLSILLDFDYYGKEYNPGEILSSDPSYPTYLDVTLVTVFGIVFYVALALYLEEVLPGKFGVRKPYNFFLKKSYWYPSKVKYGNMKSAPECKVPEDVDFEPVPDGMNVEISVRNLRKEYKSLSGRPVAAVDDVSIDFYSGGITALLGDSGAGKTSLLTAISGMTHATSGQILIHGYDVAEHTDEARRSFAYCPQQGGMLFEDITAFDNLRFFAMVKCLGARDDPEAACELLDKLKLSDVKETVVRELSGEQKRRLSLGIALIGGSDVVVLDEPTSGLDPEVRREIWQLLLSYNGIKTIILSTQSAGEAEVLSDRIAVMDRGKIKCYGTPAYLKSKYGSDHSLSVVLKNAEKAQGLTEFIRKFVKTAKIPSENLLTLTYQLPEEETTNLAMVLAGLDNMRDSGEIQSYNMNYSSFEDVFLRSRGKESEDDRIDMFDHSPCSDEAHPTRMDTLLLPFHQFYDLIVKKCGYFCRNIGSYLMFSVIALLFVITSFVIIPTVVKEYEAVKEAGRPGNFTYSLELYGKSAVPYSIAAESELSKSFVEYLAKHGWETRRVGNVEKELGKIFRDDFYAYTRETLMAIEFDGDKVKIFHNSYAVHMLPLALNAFFDGILLANNVTGEIKTSVNQMHIPASPTRHLGNISPACAISDVPDFIGIQALFYLIEPTRERLFGAKDLQLMTTSGTLYWFAHLIFDSATFAIYLLVPAFTIAFSTKDDVFFENKEEIYFGMVLWGVALILLAYVLSSVMNTLRLASAAFLALYLTGTFAMYYPVRWKIWSEGCQYLHPSSILKIGLSNTCDKEQGNHYWTALIIYSAVLFAFLAVKDCHIVRGLLRRCVRDEEPARKDANVKVQGELVKASC